ncbi:MAG: gliding motility-associated C-terminal domain-containing protein [Flavobacteriaceae bacterium]|nr:gliding motility-associated C-terminal domain-containing protein [Flavobacteriaceae bacterium]
MIKLKLLTSVRKVLLNLFFLVFALYGFAQCPTVNDPSPSICDASGFVFSDLNTFVTDIGNGIVWYDAPTGGAIIPNNQLVLEGTYYAGDNTGSCGTRDAITVDFVVDASGQNLDGIFCSNENPTVQSYIDDVLVPNIPSGGSVEVYEDFDLTTLANPADPLIGTDIFYNVFVDSGGCKSQLEIGNTAIFDSPPDPTPPLTQNFCSDTNPTVADLDPGTTDNFNWYDNIDGMGNPILPALLPSTVLVDGNTYYIQVDDFFCTSNVVAVQVFIDDPVDSGTSAVLDYCEDSIPPADFNLFDELGGSPDTTGSWTGPLATSNGHLGTVNISGLGPGTYVFTYTVPTTSAGCPDGNSTVTITIHQNFTSGTVAAASPMSFCESAAPSSFDLFSLLDGEDPGGQWTIGTLPTDPIISNPVDLSGFGPGTYDFTYTVNLLPNPCAIEFTTVQVIILEDPNPGVAINAAFCETDLGANSPFDLFNALDGSQDNNGGVWTDGNGNTVSNPIDITGFTVAGSPYTFTYTLDNGTCSDSVSVTITIEDPAEAGTATPFEICEENAASNSPLDLFGQLSGNDPGGTWSDDDATGALSGSDVDLTLLGPGSFDFTYSVTGAGSCGTDTATVTITINPQPITGTAIPFTVCETDVAANSPLDLFGQLSGNDPGGTWSDDDATGALSGSDVDLTGLAVGSYDFTYSITSGDGCSNSTTVTVTIEEFTTAGTATPLDICLADVPSQTPVDLFTQLSGNDTGGTWSDDDGSGALSGSLVDLTILTPNVSYNFTYSISNMGSCSDDFETVVITVIEIAPPTAPATQEFCDSATVADLSASGSNILWYDDATGGTALDPATALVDGEDYFASQTDTVSGCESIGRIEVTVTINMSPISGVATNSPLSVCTDNATVDLNTALDGSQDPGGTWIDTDATGQLSGSIFDATGVPPGSYDFTYLVTAIPPCTDASTVVTVIVEDPVNAGTDASLNICSDNGPVDLFALLGGADPGGTWSPALSGGGNIFDPLNDAEGTYTYTISNGCSTASSDVVITVTQAANAGSDASAALCVSDGPVDLLTLLGGTPDAGGTWSPALASGTDIFDPTVDAAGVYTYTVMATAPCSTDASAQLTISVNDSSSPTLLQGQLDFCLEDNPTVSDLDVAVSGSNIQWYDDATSTTALASTEALIDGEDYFATQDDGSGCESSSRVEVNVSVNDAPTPSLVSPGLELCINDDPTILILSDIISEYNGLDNLVWYDAATGGNIVDPNTVLVGNATYYAALIDSVSGCESSVRLAVTPDLSFCGDIIFPDGFSPNDDGVNDTYDVDNLDYLYPNFTMEIYNRNGNLVYKGGASTPRFNGRSNQSRLLNKDDLSVGVYFYIVNFNDGSTKPLQGRLYLNR